LSEPTEDIAKLVLTIELDLLPEWFEAVKRVAASHVRRLGVIEKPDQWVVMCELDRDRVEPFQAALSEAWTAFRASE